MSVLDRFWAKVDVRGPNECWEWTAAVQNWGYGKFWAGGRDITAHRFSAMLHFGMFHRHQLVLHHCDNPPCVNPAHLYLGTAQDNRNDMIARGRWRTGPNPTSTHCRSGHEYDTANTYITPDGYRQCRACNRAAVDRYRSRKEQYTP